MAVCTFFGHRDTPEKIESVLQSTIVHLIEKESADVFYIGNQGKFDGMVKKCLKQLKVRYPHINYSVVLAYLPDKKDIMPSIDYIETIFPEELESVPRKFAIDRRNKWMVERADYVIAYVKRDYGGAAKFKSIAERKGKSVFNIADIDISNMQKRHLKKRSDR